MAKRPSSQKPLACNSGHGRAPGVGQRERATHALHPPQPQIFLRISYRDARGNRSPASGRYADRGAQIRRIDRTIISGGDQSAETPHDHRMTALGDRILVIRRGSETSGQRAHKIVFKRTRCFGVSEDMRRRFCEAPGNRVQAAESLNRRGVGCFFVSPRASSIRSEMCRADCGQHIAGKRNRPPRHRSR